MVTAFFFYLFFFVYLVWVSYPDITGYDTWGEYVASVYINVRLATVYAKRGGELRLIRRDYRDT